MPIGHGNLFWLVLESHGKVMEIDFPKRVVTLKMMQKCTALVAEKQPVSDELGGQTAGCWARAAKPIRQGW